MKFFKNKYLDGEIIDDNPLVPLEEHEKDDNISKGLFIKSIEKMWLTYLGAYD